MSIDPRASVHAQLMQSLSILDEAPARAGGPAGQNGAGDDEQVGTSAGESMNGRAGDDTLSGRGGADTLVGGDGYDLLIGDDFDGAVDRLLGGTGDDTMWGGLGDVINGGTDTSDGPGGSPFHGDWAAVSIRSSADLVIKANWSGSGKGSVGVKIDGVAQDKVRLAGVEHLAVVGGSGDDRIIAGQFETELWGGSGADTLTGLAADDTLYAGSGLDSLEGGGGQDVLRATDNDGVRDRLFGDTGDDTVQGFFGDLMDGGADKDLAEFEIDLFSPVVLDMRAVLSDGSGLVVGTLGGVRQAGARLAGFEEASLAGGFGGDQIWAGAIVTTLRGAEGDDSLFGGAANDTLIGGAGNDRLAGGDGFDTARYDGATPFLVGVSANLTTHLATAHGAPNPAVGTDQLSNIEAVEGTSYTDELTGNSQANMLDGGFAGEDTLDGMGGDDVLFVNLGNSQAKTVTGGGGRDTLNLEFSSWTALTVDLRVTTAQDTGGSSLTLSSVENVSGGLNSDQLFGTNGANTLAGGESQDNLHGLAGNDVLWGDGVIDCTVDGEPAVFGLSTAKFSGLQGYLDALAELPMEEITSITHADYIYGGTGDDTIYGGLGADTLDGGTAFDPHVETPSEEGFVNIYAYQSVLDSMAGHSDLISMRLEDFIDLSDIDANAETEADDAFVIVSALTGAAGQLTVKYEPGSLLTTVTGDADGDGVGEFQIRIQGDATEFDGWIL
jgi:Ca2+-binding RTX toxin-like protein